MLKKITQFYSSLAPKTIQIASENIKTKYNSLRWSVFISATIGYSLFYVCRLSLSVVKKPIVDAGILTDSEIGMVGSALFFAYAIGKLINGFLADSSNIRRFMATGLLLTALINLALGFTTSFTAFIVLWGLSGWFQSMGAAPSVVSLSRWFSNKERGTYNGIWRASHGLGKAITFIGVAFIVSISGWEWGFWGAGLIGLAGALIVALFLNDSPESEGLPSIADYKNDHTAISIERKSVGSLQKEVLKNPYIWVLALASALMYVSRYGIESWGIYYLEAQKGYTTLEASSIVSVSAFSGIFGTIIAGIISDKFFKSSRNIPVLIAGILNVIAITLFLYYPDGSPWVDTASMVLFGFAIGILITFVGGLMAVDIASKKASGAALGMIGIASYVGAGVQDAVSGYLIGDNHTILNGVDSYDFSTVKLFWLGSALLSVICALFVWNAKSKD